MGTEPKSEANVTVRPQSPPRRPRKQDRMAEILHALQAMRNGDFSARLPGDWTGIEGKVADTFNEIASSNGRLAHELLRVGQVVGKEGKTSQLVKIGPGGGAWDEMEASINTLIGDLLWPMKEVTRAISAVAQGDLQQTVRADRHGRALEGEFMRSATIVNAMIQQLGVVTSEVTRVARQVGIDGKLGGQAQVPGVGGVWRDMTQSVNSMASNLTAQVRNIAEVTIAVANGDLSKKITVDVRGEILLLKEAINTMVDQLRSFASEVTRVAREVGTDGKLGGQAIVPGVAGTWKDLTDNVNLLAANLTTQVRNIAEVTTAVARGDLSRKITVDVHGEILELKETINTMVDQLNGFASEVTRVAREVGTEGKLGGQAEVPGVAGIWKDLTDNVNSMAGNLTDQVRNIAQVTTAVARGDLSKQITVVARGEILELMNTINTMVDQLNAFAAEVTRVAREVGTEGKLGGQAEVPGVDGTWKDLTDNVNSMAGNLTDQVRNIAEVATAIARGDLSKQITVDVRGEILELKNTINTMVDQLNAFASEVTRVAREVGTEGKLGGQAEVPGVGGTWKDLTDNVNSMAGNLTAQVRNIAQVTTAVARGDLSKKITVDARGEILELKNTINTMVDQLNAFAAEVTRVAREVGTEGRLGGQAQVPGVAGTWKDLTDNVNVMAANLTEQVRGVVKVVTAVADGVLEQKLTVKSKGEIAALAETINNMIDTLATFADQVTTVAREVGVEGRLGGQANVPGASGTWKDLTANVNRLAANLTTQVRAIAEVATAVARGDMTRSIQVDARGEVAELKDNINTMIGALRLTTESNREQDWLKTNQARFTGMLQGQRDLTTVGNLVLSELIPLVGAHQGLIYQMSTDDASRLSMLASYGNPGADGYPRELHVGSGLIGQCAADRRRILITEVPADTPPIDGTLFKAPPRSLVVLPVVFEGRIKAVIALASLGTFSTTHMAFLEQLTSSIGIVLNSIEATMQTENLLDQSQKLAVELQTRQSELQQTNEQLAQKAQQLAEQNAEVERKNQLIEVARRELEEKAAELALTSKYKSEFLANMSHELRTPLNSILVLSQQLALNSDGNLSSKQVEFGRTIHGAGSDLLTLITDILDLSKIESGTVTVEAEEVAFTTLFDTAKRYFRHEADSRGLTFEVELDRAFAHARLVTDPKRLMQVLKNLLSNAFKFTEQGSVKLSASVATDGWSPGHRTLDAAGRVVAFRVQDTGIGIPPEKQKLIFEAFQQADAGTSRKYGGTGLGLAISRELAGLLGGEIVLTSQVGTGSTFTIFLPMRYAGPGPVPQHVQSAKTPRSTPGLYVSHAPIDRIEDDRESLAPGDVSLLVVEDDPDEARTLVDVARKAGFKVIVATRGAEALSLARNHLPAAITLDLSLPDLPAWSVLSELKQDALTRHIPVQVVAQPDDAQQRRPRGAFGLLTKPLTQEVLDDNFERLRRFALPRRRRTLIVEDDAGAQTGITALLEHDGADIVSVGTGGEALECLRTGSFDCVVLDLSLPDISGFDLLQRIHDDDALGGPPVVVFTGRTLNPEEQERLQRLAHGVVIKDAESPERLLDETTLLMHVPTSQLKPEQWRMIQRLNDSDEDLVGKLVLIVDDDVRNIFALSSVLEDHGMQTISATTGADAIAQLDAKPEVAIVLMDIMMPEMDGYQTMRAVRQNPAHRSLPIIALTAKAMKADRERCLEAGASDYLAKPVDTFQLLSSLRVWLQR